jgi:four helix bundle protein
MDNNISYKGGFTELETWKEARILKQGIIKIVKEFPPEEKYNLIDQIRRSSRSITANIAEGYGRFNYQETIQFIRQARGSLTETLDHLITAMDEAYINEEIYKRFEKQYEKVLKLINGYISFLKTKKLSNLNTKIPNTLIPK